MLEPAMTAEEADEIVNWAQDALAMTMTPWQKELLAIALMHPGRVLELRRARNGR